MLGALALALLLAGSSPERDAARAELDAVAVRIQHLKALRAAGRDVHAELHRLLVRSQELAFAIDRLDHPAQRSAEAPRLRGPTPDELRERADLARDEADRLRAELGRTEARIASVHAEAVAQAGTRVPEANLVSAGGARTASPTGQRLAMLEAKREQLVLYLRAALAEAERLEAEAKLLESLP